MRGVFRSLMVSLWFMALTFPLLVVRVSPLDGSIELRLKNALILGVSIFVLSFVWRALLAVKGIYTREEADMDWLFTFLASEQNRDRTVAGAAGVICLAALAFGFSAGRDPITLTICLGIAALCFTIAVASLTARRKVFFGAIHTGTQQFTEPGLPRTGALALVLCILVPLPFFVDIYQVNILAQTFIWVMLGLGLNIVVGQAGLLVLGYVAFYAVGAYSYAVLNANFGSVVGFWTLLPVAGLFAALAGILLSLPVLRLRGDYLAIVTLGFGEIVRVTLEGGSLSLSPLASLIGLFTSAEMPAWMTTPLEMGGPAGISQIPYPSFFGVPLSMDSSIRYVYFIALCMTILTIFVVGRLRDSRLGRSWMALREDEIACEAMGINKVTAKLTAFALGACWAGFGGVLFAAKNTYINPSAFTFMESALILSVVVLGGMGSILGVILGACVLILLPEYLRAFNEYRMLIFGASMVLMMVFRPQGLITPQAKKRIIPGARKALDANTSGNDTSSNDTPMGGTSPTGTAAATSTEGAAS